MTLTEFLLIIPCVLTVLYVLWYLFFTDVDLTLYLAEKFGRPISVYRGKVIWVTGASTGLGEAVAYELAVVGAKLILSARNEARLASVKNRCLEISEGKLCDRDILVLPLDVTADYDALRTKANFALNHFEKIDVLINNAGRSQVGCAVTTDIEVDKAMFDVNFFGSVMLAKLVLKHFLHRGEGQIVVISSTAGKCAAPSLASYCATKHALNGYFGALRTENKNNNVHITVVCPAKFKSELSCNAMGTNKEEILGTVFEDACEMPVSRCAYMTLIASANRLNEVWIAYQPYLVGIWCAHYMPWVYTHLMMFFCTEDILNGAFKGRTPKLINTFSWKPFYFSINSCLFSMRKLSMKCKTQLSKKMLSRWQLFRQRDLVSCQ